MKLSAVPIYILPLMMMASFTCNSGSKTEKSTAQKDDRNIELNKPLLAPNGYTYTFLALGTGPKIQAGDMVKAHYVGKLSDSTVFDESRTANRPFSFKVGAGQVIKGWDEGFAFLRQGDKAVITVPPDKGYGNNQAGKIPPNSVLHFEVEVLEVKEGRKPYDVAGKDTLKTASGLKYIMVKSVPSGAKPEQGDKLKVHYSGYLPDGTLFDSSVDRGDPFQFPLGKSQVIKGWDEALGLMRKGEKARLIIPSELAYGDRGVEGGIPPNATLVFDVELIDFSPKVVIVPYDIKGIQPQVTSSGLKFYIIHKGSGKKAENGKLIKAHYSGYTSDGKMFDSSIERDQPLQFQLGAGQVIPGWEEAFRMMNVGDKFRLVIPHHLAYGENGYPPVIPPKAELTFDVELIDVVDMNMPAGGHEGHDHSDPNHKH